MSMIELVKKAAEQRGESLIPDSYINQALQLIEKGEIKVESYPSGAPSLKGVYEIAMGLFTNSVSPN